jgi:hypothetical protein
MEGFKMTTLTAPEQTIIDFSFTPQSPIIPETTDQPKSKQKYTMTDAKRQADLNAIRVFSVSPVNAAYINAFRDTRYPAWETDPKQKASWLQYKSSVGSFLEIVGKDAVIVKATDFENFVAPYENQNTKNNKTAHIKAFLTHIIVNNVSNCNTRVSREVLIMILGM